MYGRVLLNCTLVMHRRVRLVVIIQRKSVMGVLHKQTIECPVVVKYWHYFMELFSVTLVALLIY